MKKKCSRNCASENTSDDLFEMPGVKEVKSASVRRRVTFSIKAAVGSQVFLAGSFNDWNAESIPMKDSAGTGHFKCIKLLAPGRYEYKFVINGLWDIDAENPLFVANDMGSMNSVIEVE